MLENFFSIVNSKIQILLHDDNIEKRGIINGIGSIIKSITGNLDATDQEKYDNALKSIKENENILKDNINQIIIFNKNISDYFNKQVEKINANNKIIQNKINEMYVTLGKIIDTNDKLYIENIITQLTFGVTNLISILNEIETTFAFCETNTLYFGILSREDIKLEINKLLPTSLKNLIIKNWQNQQLVKTYCKYEKLILDIIIDIPIPLVQNELLQITPIPTLHNITYVTLEITPGYYTKSNTHINKLNKCTFVEDKLYICNNENSLPNKCIENLYFNRNNNNCKYTRVLNHNEIISIPNSNIVYLFVPNKEVINIECDHEIQNEEISGIFSIKNCLINKQKLFNNVKYDKIVNLNINHNTSKFILNKTMNIKNLEQVKIPLQQITHLNEIKTTESHSIFFDIILGIVSIVVVIYLVYKIYAKIKNRNPTNPNKNDKLTCETIPIDDPTGILSSQRGGIM